MSSKMEKLSDLFKLKGQFTYSFEVTPDVCENDLNKFDVDPIFFSITWHAHIHQCRDLNIPPLRLASYLARHGKRVLLHITCSYIQKKYLNTLLLWLQKNNICNLFIVLGDNYDPNFSDFDASHKLIRYIRQKTQDYFCIGVAGFPNNEYNISALKQKVESGADFIVTQAFFEYSTYNNFVEKCKDEDINIPIIPGVFVFKSQKELISFVNFCKVDVSEDFKQKLENKTGLELIEILLLEMINEMQITHFHFFTLNKLNMTSDIIKKIQSQYSNKY